jgi:hypothetical protein
VQLTAANLSGFADFLRETTSGAAGKTDVIAFFFRRSFDLLRRNGTLGLLATKTIRQGDTRESGLTKILSQGGTIYSVTRRLVWPGEAAVVVSIVHIMKGESEDPASLDGVPVKRISAYLVNGNTDNSPPAISPNKRPVAGYGNKPNGSGFIFSARPKEYENTLSLKDALLAEHPEYASIIRPFVGGTDLNAMVGHSPSRWIIDFGDRTLHEAKEYPELIQLLEASVRPHVTRKNWWQFEHRAHQLKAAIKEYALESIIVVPDASDTLAFSIVPSNWTLSNSTVGFAWSGADLFAVLQSRVHELWVRELSLSLKDDIRYVPGVCVEAFPFPEGWDRGGMLSTAGSRYYEFRAALMTRNNEGMTKTYNRFHNPEEQHPDIQKLRELHAVMDRAVLAAYGWADIDETCEFVLDYEIDEEEWGDKKKPYRYRWPDDVRDEVLARLLELNAERARDDARSGALAAKGGGNRGAKSSAAMREADDLFS